jgi:bifunctional non-homologous end joining protein LigD
MPEARAEAKVEMLEDESAGGKPARPAKAQGRAAAAGEGEGAARRHAGGRGQGRLPETLTPELATLVDGPPDPEEWIFEIKFDGYRMLTRVEGKDIRLVTRNGNDWTDKLRRCKRKSGA